jgi:hypothetical protein
VLFERVDGATISAKVVARAIAMAMPILRKAKRVIVLSPSGKEAAGHLQTHGIDATEKSIAARGQRPGVVLLAETRSRLRQMIFGGANQHILAGGKWVSARPGAMRSSWKFLARSGFALTSAVASALVKRTQSKAGNETERQDHHGPDTERVVH